MKLTILGSGTCVNQLPNVPNRFPPGFLIEWDNEKLLLDCSEGIRFRIEQAGVDFTNINHVAISHPHPDHCAIIQFIQAKYVSYAWQHQENHDLHIYCPDFIKNNFPNLWNFHNPDIEKNMGTDQTC
jgi:ribonuclease BN (tRNA processing enzyme)